jgi:hypothetical protein
MLSTVPENETLVGATVPARDRSGPQVTPIEQPFWAKTQSVTPPHPISCQLPASWGHGSPVLASDASLGAAESVTSAPMLAALVLAASELGRLAPASG